MNACFKYVENEWQIYFFPYSVAELGLRIKPSHSSDHTGGDKISTVNFRLARTYKEVCFCICSFSCSPLLVQSNTDPKVLTPEGSVKKHTLESPEL